MVFDDASGKVLLFGGSGDYSPAMNDTWEWDGAVWTLRATGAPAARESHAMAFDPVTQRVLMFGGYSGTTLQDTWEWTGTQWLQSHTVL